MRVDRQAVGARGNTELNIERLEITQKSNIICCSDKVLALMLNFVINQKISGQSFLCRRSLLRSLLRLYFL